RRQLSRNRDRFVVIDEVVQSRRLTRHQGRPVAVSHAGARGQERIPVRQVRKRVNAYCRDLQLALQGTTVECLYILELVDEPQPIRIQPIVRECVKHKRVIGIRTMTNPDSRGTLVIHPLWSSSLSLKVGLCRRRDAGIAISSNPEVAYKNYCT